MSGYEIRQVTTGMRTATEQGITAFCPPGKRAVGGGFELSSISPMWPAPTAAASLPSPSGDGWMVKAGAGPSPTSNWELKAFAVCVNVAP